MPVGLASVAVSAHANIKAVQRMLGHAKASMTLDIYVDLFDEDSDRLDSASAIRLLRTNCGLAGLRSGDQLPRRSRLASPRRMKPLRYRG